MPSPHTFASLVTALAFVGCATPAPAPPRDASADESPPDDVASDTPTMTDRPAPRCDLAPLPAWARTDGAPHRVVLTGSRGRLRVEALADGVMRLRYEPADEAPATRPSWAIVAPPSPATDVVTGSSGDRAVVCTDALRVEVSPDSLRVRVTDAAGMTLLEDPTDGGWQSTAQGVSVTRRAPEGERYFGLGEKTGPLDHRGRRFVFWNTDAYDTMHGGFAPDADPLYASVPLVLGLRGGTAWGVFTDNTHRLEIDLARASPNAWTVRATGGAIDQYVIAGPALRDVVRRYTALTGRIPMPPRWALGYHQSRWGYSPSARVEEIAREFRTRRIPADGIWLDIQHMRGFRTFTWEPTNFADPAGLVTRLSAQGFKLTVIADPGIKQDTAWDVYNSGVTENVFHRHPDGSLAIGAAWPGASAFPDFTLPAGRAWWSRHVGTLASLGVRGVWLDVNEPTTFPEGGGGATLPDTVRAHGEGTPTTLAEVHNVYAMGETRATWEGLRSRSPERRPFVLTRAGYAGIQRYAAMWTGDAPSTWWSLRQSLPMLLGMGVSGLSFVGSDVGGYSGRATPELFARWMALGVISPFFRGHVTQGVNDQEPWAFGQEVEDISRAFLQERYRLIPYLYSLFDESRRTGAPILRPLVYEFQGESAIAATDDEAMLGPWLLAAPVLTEGATRRPVTLPAGRWYEYSSGAVYEGPTTIDLEVTRAALALYVREGAILPRGPVRQFTDDGTAAALDLDVYPSARASRFTLYEDAGDGFAHEQDGYSRVTYTLAQTADGATLRASRREGSWTPPARPLTVRVHRVDHLPTGVTLGGRALTRVMSLDALTGAGEGWFWDEHDLALVVKTRDSDDFELVFRYDTTLTAPRPTVDVMFVVRVPDGTPRDRMVHVALSSRGWQHIPLAWGPAPGTASGRIAVPRGEWFFYKYTRGDWATVEKWAGCVEATNRYGFGSAHPDRADSVATWADRCP